MEKTNPIKFEMGKNRTNYCIDFDKVKSFKSLLKIFKDVGFNIIVEKWTIPPETEKYMMKLDDFKANESGK